MKIDDWFLPTDVLTPAQVELHKTINEGIKTVGGSEFTPSHERMMRCHAFIYGFGLGFAFCLKKIAPTIDGKK